MSLGFHKLIPKINQGKPFYEKNICDSLFTWKELEAIINIRPLTNIDRFHTTAKVNGIEWESSAWLSDQSSIPAHCLIPIIKQGVCWLSDMSRVNKKINTVCNYIEEQTKGTVDAHIYFDLHKSKINTSLNQHWDLSDNIIVQMSGITNFKVWNIKKTEGERGVYTEEKPIIDIIMKKGDVVYIPKYLVHQAVSMSKRLSISFPISNREGELPQDREWINIVS